jgi:CheY-like chemotaxis protein
MNDLKTLIVEDDESSSKLISIVMSKFGAEIINARTGDEAVEACRLHPELNLVLMDIQLPEMDGYEATKLIRQFNKSVIIIAQTAFALAGDREKSIEAGCTDYISKPIKRDELNAILQKYFK